MQINSAFIHSKHIIQIPKHLGVCKKVKLWHIYREHNSLI